MAESNPTTARQFHWRRLFQFRLRTLLILTTIIAAVFGWWSHKARQQREAVAALKKVGAEVLYDTSLPWTGKMARLKWPQWLLEHLDINYFARVIQVKHHDQTFAAFGDSYLGKHFSDAEMQCLKNLTSTRYLLLDYTKVSDLSPLVNSTKMVTLGFSGTQVSDLSSLVGMHGLEFLMLDRTQVCDLRPLATLTKLYKLHLGGTPVSDLSPLTELTSLGELYIQEMKVKNLSPLAKLHSLTRLDFSDTQVSDLSPLSGLTNLQVLFLRNTPVSNEQVTKLQKALPNCKIER